MIKKKEYIIVIRKTLDFPIKVKAETQREAKEIASGVDIAKLKGKPVTKREETTISKYRTDKQNKAIHLYLSQVSEALNELGITPEEFLEAGFEMFFTKEYLKTIWKGIQKKEFNTNSTILLKKGENQIDTIYDIFNKKLAQFEIFIPFPDKDTKRLEEEALKINFNN